ERDPRRDVSRPALARALGGGGAQRRHHRRALAAPAGADRRDVRGCRPHPQTINELRRRPGHPDQRDPRPPRRGPAVDIAARRSGAHSPRPPGRTHAMFAAAAPLRNLVTPPAAGRATRISGTHARLEGARLWTLPPAPPKILIATAGPLTARRAGRHADGFIT